MTINKILFHPLETKFYFLHKMKSNTALKVTIILFLELFSIIQGLETKLQVQSLLSAVNERKKIKTKKEDLKDGRSTIKAVTGFDKRDYGLHIGLKTKITWTYKSKSYDQELVIKVVFDWKTNGKFQCTTFYPGKDTSVSVFRRLQNFFAGYKKLKDEDKKAPISSTEYQTAIKTAAKNAAKALIKWVITFSIKTLISILLPFLAPFILIYDLVKEVTRLSSKVEKNEKKSTDLGHEIKTAYLQYTVADLGVAAVDAIIGVDYNPAVFENIFKSTVDWLKKKWQNCVALVKAKLKSMANLLSGDNNKYYQLPEEKDPAEDYNKDVEALNTISKPATKVTNVPEWYKQSDNDASQADDNESEELQTEAFE